MKKYNFRCFKAGTVLMAIKFAARLFITAYIMFLSLPVFSQTTITVTGKVVNEKNEPVPGASVQQEGTNTYVISGDDGSFSIQVTDSKANIGITSVGYNTKSISLADGYVNMTVQLNQNQQSMENVVVVGYGKQKKESVLGAISQVTGKELERAGGVTNLGMALTGTLPGLVTSSSSGMPGAEDPQIVIRAQSSWNSSSPLILIDGVERSMSSIDISSVESISILKDASATAVFGVKGANGVILINTKQGKAGKANIQVRSNMTMKVASRLPEKYDAYDAFLIRNEAIKRELLYSNLWGAYKPLEIIEKYRNPLTTEEWDKYPNVDWAKELFSDHAMSYNTSANVSGGSKFVTYFAGIDFVNEGDLFRKFSNNRGYDAGYGYNRINARSNLDFNITKTTRFTTRLFGSNGIRKVPWGAGNGDQSFWASAYRTAPDAMRPIYSNGMWGWYAPRNADVPNSAYRLAVSGVEKLTSNQLTTDFVLQQDLKMITRGLSLRANYSIDNTFGEVARGVNDLYNDAQRVWYNPETEGYAPIYEQVINAYTQLDYPTNKVSWTLDPGNVNIDASYRRLNYSGQVNYARKFGKHDVTAMGVFLRERFVTGSDWNRFREDWVFRATYNFDTRYFFEANGAYNGSEKYGPGYRFAFFPSFSGGWTISNEKFMQGIRFINTLRLRASWGRIGDDNAGGRWLYRDQISSGGNTLMGSPPANTPYSYFRITTLGNPNISWETSEKRNLGVDYSFFEGFITGSMDVFNDYRNNIIITNPTVPSYFGATMPSANLGSVKGQGYEVDLRFNRAIGNNVRVWVNTNFTHAQNKVIFRDDPELRPGYQKNAGYAIGQTRAYLDYGYLSSWDDIYGSTTRSTPSSQNKLPGDYNIIDFNADGVIDQNDSAPYGYTGTPQNTYNASIGADWKGLSVFVQFYGVNNVTRIVDFPSFHSSSNVVYAEGTYWTKEGGGDVPLPRWSTLGGPEIVGTRYYYDGSYVRLKNAELAYTFNGNFVNRMGMKSCKLYLNGNNLLLWTKMPDDRESNFSGSASFGAYPTMKRYNLGIDINF